MTTMPQVALRPCWRLRAARASQRKRKKERRRAAKTAASTFVDQKGARTPATLGPRERPVLAYFQCFRGERKRSTESTEEEREGRFKYDGSGPCCGASNIDL